MLYKNGLFMESVMLNVAGNGYVQLNVERRLARRIPPSIVEKDIRPITKIID
jgi:hypothetical protein